MTSRRNLWLLLTAFVSVSASVAAGIGIADHQRSAPAQATRAWHGRVTKVSRSGAASSDPGAFSVTASGQTPLVEGAELSAGSHLATDGRTRIKIEFDDGSSVVVDRASDVTVGATPRTLTVAEGAVLADVAHIDGAPFASLKTPNGVVKVLGTKLLVTAASDRTNVEVLRGEVEVATGQGSRKVFAGQEGVVARDGNVDVTPVSDLAQRSAFGAEFATHNEDAEAPASGLGELRARRPGRTDEKDRALHLRKHGVKVRIVGNVARTEIDETFANDTDDELEGIYRFPLPSGAQIERLALEVDGKLVDGEFVDRSKASAIWRGAIHNAAPKTPKPREEIVWVPGPWHDPALLEWQRGGRFELRIFPIPKHGSRRVIIAYTETIAPASGVRRYVYPLPQGASSRISIDQFSVDAQVLGHDARTPVRVRGYELDHKTEGGAEILSSTMTGFSPSGDIAIEYGLDDKATDATAWAYREEPSARDQRTPTTLGKTDPVGTDGFVAIALRPKLPKWVDTKPRDQVIVLDAGLSMVGERFARAKRLAVQMTQEMDRRDRVTVLACDVSCRSLPGGFVAPGAPTAHDVDAFLQGVKPDGASDLVGAVRTVSKLGGRDAGRDLRVVVLSDGVATAGYRSAGRVSAEVGDALGGLGTVVTVPIGSDADVNLLSSIARGGGGVVVPYQPGQRLEATALEVLNATYGTTLRDVEVVLPEGLRDVAPTALAPIRAGSEAIVTARMTGDAVKGDVILRGKVGGDPFEAKYPIDLRATTDAGNAFVPRLFAAARIADRERESGDAGRAELVALSRRFSVPSRTTSLLVLESEAMFKAFGIERAEHGTQWTGEGLAQATAVATANKGDDSESGLSMADAPAADESKDSVGRAEAPKKKTASADLGGLGLAGPSTRSAPGASVPAPAPTMAAPAQAPLDKADAWADERPARRVRSPGQFMKKVWVRHANVTNDATVSVSPEKVAQARAAVAASPDERTKHKDLARMLALTGAFEELSESLDKWAARDPLDVDVVTARADLAARKGDRDGSLRILGGALAAPSLAPADAFTLMTAVGRSYERLGRAESCAFDIGAAELKPADAPALARAIECERTQGRASSADRWLTGLAEATRSAVRAAITKRQSERGESAVGDIVVSATWTGGVDLDVALVDPAGRRAAAVSRLRNARVEGAASRDHEIVALSTGDAGAFLVELTRADVTAPSTAPVTGTVTIRSFGQSRTIPFALAGVRTQVGRVDVRWESELVPLSPGEEVPPFVGTSSMNGINRGRAMSVLAAVPFQHCSASGQVGTGHVTVTFQPSGRVGDVVVDDATFSGTPAGRCVQTAFFGTMPIEPFVGGAVRIGRNFTLSGRSDPWGIR